MIIIMKIQKCVLYKMNIKISHANNVIELVKLVIIRIGTVYVLGLSDWFFPSVCFQGKQFWKQVLIF